MKKYYTIITNKTNDFECNIETQYKKNTGSFYTSMDLTKIFWNELLEKITKEELLNYKILEPCVGSGNYIFSLLFLLHQKNYNTKEILKIINNIYVVDINKNAIDFYKNTLNEILNTLFHISLQNDYFNTHISTKGLIFNIVDDVHYIDFKDIFPDIKFKFDIVITNPPYKLLKNDIGKEKLSDIRILNKQYFPNCDTLNINLYKFFIEEIIKNYTNDNAWISLLVPTTIMKDLSCTKLRKYIIDNTSIINIKIIEERNDYIKANQSMCNLLLKKEKVSNCCFSIYENINSNDSNEYSKIEMLNNPYYEILSINKNFKGIFDKLSKISKIKDFNFIKIYRGELDLSIHKNSITTKNTTYPIIRGRSLQNNTITTNNEYVLNSFVENSKKKNYIHNTRIAFQQVSNMNKQQRLNFVLCPPNYVLGNSCNFLYIENNSYNIDNYYMLALLNSYIINQYYKLFSSNNHINVYEIENLPLLISQNPQQISNAYQDYLKGLLTKDDIEKIICKEFFNDHFAKIL